MPIIQLVGRFFWYWFSDVERRKGHEYIRLEECHQEFKEPKWKRKDPECTRVKRWNLLTNIDRHRYKDHTNENIEKETHREWPNTNKLTGKVEPSYKDAYDLFSGWITMIVPEIVSEVMDDTLEFDSSKLRDHNHCEREDESSGEIRIHRTKIVSESMVSRYKNKPIKHKSIEIPEKYDDHEPSEKPDISLCDTTISEKSRRIRKNSLCDIKSKSFESREFISSYSIWKNTYQEDHETNKYPSWENCIGNMKFDICNFSERHDNITFWCRDMGTSSMFRSSIWMCIICRNFMKSCRHCMFFCERRCSSCIRYHDEECSKCECTIDNTCNHKFKSHASIGKSEFFASSISRNSILGNFTEISKIHKSQTSIKKS